MPEEIKKPEQPKPKIVHSFLCEKCGYESKTQDEYRLHKVDHTLGREFKRDDNSGEVVRIDKVEAPVVPQKAPETKKTPITLHYKFKGKCDCGSDVETIEIVLDKQNVCVAYCEKEKRQLFQQKVIPIVEQIK